MSPEEDSALRGYAMEVPGGYFYARGARNLLSRATLTSAPAAPVGTTAAPETIYPGIGFWRPYSPHFPLNGGLVGTPLGDHLSRALADPSYALYAQGPMQAWSASEGLPRYEAEWSAMLNVAEWRISGQAGGFSFDEIVPTGSRRRYNPTLQSGDYTTAPNSRSAFGFEFWFSDSSGSSVEGDLHQGSLRIAVGLAEGLGSRTAGVLVRYHATPPGMVMLPQLTLTAQHSDQATSSSGQTRAANSLVNPADWSTPAADGRATFLGRPLILIDQLATAPADFELAITAESYWDASDPWRGEESA